MFTCPICNLFGGNSFASVLRHIGEVHRFDPGLTIRCGIERCPQTYSNYESFRSHVYRKHRHVLHSTLSTTDASRSESSIDISNVDTSNSIDNHLTEEVINIKDAGAKFVLKVREEYRIPQTTLNKIINDVKGLWVTALDSIKAKVKKEVESVPPDLVGDVLRIVFHLMALKLNIFNSSIINSTLTSINVESHVLPLSLISELPDQVSQKALLLESPGGIRIADQLNSLQI